MAAAQNQIVASQIKRLDGDGEEGQVWLVPATRKGQALHKRGAEIHALQHLGILVPVTDQQSIDGRLGIDPE